MLLCEIRKLFERNSKHSFKNCLSWYTKMNQDVDSKLDELFGDYYAKDEKLLRRKEFNKKSNKRTD